MSRVRKRPVGGNGALRPRRGQATVALKVDRELKRAWETALERLKAASREGASAFDVKWETVDEIVRHDPPLYLAAGVATEDEFFRRYLGETSRTARRFMRVARYASPAEENRFGVSKLDAAITLVEAKAGGATKGRVPVDFSKLRVEIRRDGKARRVPLAEATVEEVLAAARAEVRAGKAPRRRVAPEVRAVTDLLKKGTAPLKRVTVSYAQGRFALGHIERAALPALGRLLQRIELPE